MGNKIILRIQAKSAKEDELLSVDGNRIETSNDEYYALSNQTIDVRTCREIIGGEGLKVYKSKSPDKRIIIQSNFREKDVVGRRIAFTSSIATGETDDVIGRLQNEASIYGYSLCQEEVDRIKEALDKKSMLPFMIIAILIMGMVAVTLLK